MYFGTFGGLNQCVQMFNFEFSFLARIPISKRKVDANFQTNINFSSPCEFLKKKNFASRALRARAAKFAVFIEWNS